MRLLLGNSKIGDYNILGSIIHIREKLLGKNTYIGGSGSSLLALLLCMNKSLNEIFNIYDMLGKYSKRYNWDRDNMSKLLSGSLNVEILELNRVLYAHIGDATFKNVQQEYKNSLEILTYNLNKGVLITLSASSSPNMKVVDALILSMSLPGKYSVGHYNGETYVDPTVITRYPSDYVTYDMGICVREKYHDCITAIINAANIQYSITDKDIILKDNSKESISDQLTIADRFMRLTMSLRKIDDYTSQ